MCYKIYTVTPLTFIGYIVAFFMNFEDAFENMENTKLSVAFATCVVASAMHTSH